MKRNAVLAACAVSVFVASVPLMAADVIWSANDADPDNILTNEVHFTPAAADIPRTNSLSLTAASDMTVRLPAGSDWSVPFGLKFFAVNGRALTLDFADAVLTQPDTTAESPYTQDGRFGFGRGTDYLLQYARPGELVKGAFRIEDGLLTITNNIGGTDSVDFWRGTWDFLAPNATTNSGGYLYIAAGATTARTFHMNFHSGSELRAPIFFIYGNARTNEINVLGGSHYMANLQMRIRNSGGPDPYARTRVNVLGADTCLTIGGFAANSGEALHGYRVSVGDGGTLVSKGNIYQKADMGHHFVFDGGRFNTAGKNIVWENMSVFSTNSQFEVASSELCSGRMELTDSDWTCAELKLGRTSGRSAVLRIDGGTFRANTGYVGYYIAGSTGVVEVAGGTVTLNNILYLGHIAGAFGGLTVSGGELTEKVNLVLGGAGSSEMTVSGGRVSTPKIHYVWNDASTDTTNVLRQTGGEIVVGETFSMIAAGGSTRARAELVLEGGVLETPVVAGGPGCNACDPAKTGIAVLHGNGGTLRAATASANFIHSLSSATCGTRGLTVESEYDITIPQSFADADGTSGELILAGSGTKTLSGTATTVSRIVVAGGTVVFAAGARAASEVVVTNGARAVFIESPSVIGVTGLLCGDASGAGVLTVTSGSPLDFGSAPVTFNKVNLFLDGAFASGSSYVMLRTTAAVSEASKTAWAAARGADGFAESRSYAFSSSETDGTVSFEMAVSDAARTFTVATGSETVSDAVAVAPMASIVADVASDATLTLAGALSGGELSKTGDGRLSLENAGNSFVRGVACAGGLLSAASLGALGIVAETLYGLKLTGGTFEYRGDGTPATLPGALWLATPNKRDPVGLKIESPLTVNDVVVDGGAIIKRGAAPLTFALPSGADVNLAPSAGANTGGDPKSPYSIGDLSDDTGALPSTGFLGFNVAEGEVRLAGDSNTTFRFATAMIGVSATNGRVQPSLTIDGVKADFSGSFMTVHLNAFTQSGSFNVAPTLSISNGANVIMHTFICGRNTGIYNYPTVTVDRATWTLSSFSSGYNWNSYPRYFFRNDAVINAGRFYCYGPSYLFVTNSVVRKNAAGECTTAELHANAGKWLFGAGSTLALSAITTDSASPCTAFTLSFDGGTWETGGSADLFHLYMAENFTFETLGAGGLTLPVAAGKTLAVGRAISGDGGIVKTGPGTLAFETQGTWTADLTEKTALDDPVSLAFAGELDVREGAVSVENGACRAGGAYKAAEGTSIDFGGNALGAGTAFSGAGTFANASVGDCTVSATLTGDAAPNFADVAFTGRIRVKFDEEITGETEPVTVATFTGAVPDLSKFYTGKLGGFYTAVFLVDGGAVKAAIVRSGAIVIIR